MPPSRSTTSLGRARSPGQASPGRAGRLSQTSQPRAEGANCTRIKSDFDVSFRSPAPREGRQIDQDARPSEQNTILTIHPRGPHALARHTERGAALGGPHLRAHIHTPTHTHTRSWSARGRRIIGFFSALYKQRGSIWTCLRSSQEEGSEVSSCCACVLACLLVFGCARVGPSRRAEPNRSSGPGASRTI